MSRFIIILLIISILFSLLVIGGFLLPATYEAQSSITINAKHNIIHPYLNDFQQWEKWSAWSKQYDPAMQYRYPKGTKGEGAVQQWKGDKLGSGEIKLTESVSIEGIKYQLKMEQARLDIKGSIRYEFDPSKPDATKVVWTGKGQVAKNNPVFRYFAQFLDDMLKKDFDKSLQNLKAMIEK